MSGMISGTRLCDSHCHFFSNRFFEFLAREKGISSATDESAEITKLLNWDWPGSPGELADRWIRELDRHGLERAALIASVPGDEESVAAAVAKYPQRFVGFFMLNPTSDGAADRAQWARVELGLRCVCLFPAMHQYSICDERALKVFALAASLKGTVVFVHCGVLSVGVRKKLGLPSRFAMRFSNPLDIHSIALTHPDLPIIIPHFGAGFFREVLMLADLCPNIYLDTSSSNSWIKYEPALSLPGVFRCALDVVGPERLLFGTDSSFFPRGWQKPIWEAQKAILDEIGVGPPDQQKIFADNFNRLFA